METTSTWFGNARDNICNIRDREIWTRAKDPIIDEDTSEMIPEMLVWVLITQEIALKETRKSLSNEVFNEDRIYLW